MNNPPFDDITKKIDKHFEKTGVVLVGMHQELQEQKHRIGQYHEKVDAVTSDLTRRRDEIVADLRARAEAAVASMDEIDSLVQKVRSVAQDANEAIQSAGVALETSTRGLSQSHIDFRAEAQALIGRVNGSIASFSSDTASLLKHVSAQQALSIAAAVDANRLALDAIVIQQDRLLASAQNEFRDSIAKLEEKLSTHIGAHKKFLRSAYDELSERQRVSDAAFAVLKFETERHQDTQIAFAKKTRLIIGALVAFGFAVVGALMYGKRGGPVTLDDLYAEYKTRENTGRRAFNNLAKRFQEGRNTTFIEAAACSAAVMGLHIDAGFDSSELTPELQEAFRLAFPNLNIEDVGNYSGEQLEGLLQPWKGKLFEVSVRDRLNNGQWVGDYHLEPGQHAELAASATQPGWDMQILNADGSVADLIQLKATNYVAYVESALDRYPEYDVLATVELGAHEGSIDGLAVSDLSDTQLESQLSDAVSGDDFGLLASGLPLIPLALNLYWVAKGSRSATEAATSVALSAGAIVGGDFLGDVATDVIGDAVIDGIGSAVLDGIFGFGLFTLGRWLLGSSDRRERQQARARAEHARVERLAIDSTCRHINERFEGATKALDRIGTYYRPTA